MLPAHGNRIVQRPWQRTSRCEFSTFLEHTETHPQAFQPVFRCRPDWLWLAKNRAITDSGGINGLLPPARCFNSTTSSTLKQNVSHYYWPFGTRDSEHGVNESHWNRDIAVLTINREAVSIHIRLCVSEYARICLRLARVIAISNDERFRTEPWSPSKIIVGSPRR